MIFYADGKWNMCSEKVKYLQHDEEKEQYVGSEGHQWWLDFAGKWAHTEIVEFTEVNPTQEQFKRLEQINQLGVRDGFTGTFSDYVESGVYPEGLRHPLRILQTQSESEMLMDYVLDVDFRLILQEMGGM